MLHIGFKFESSRKRENRKHGKPTGTGPDDATTKSTRKKMLRSLSSSNEYERPLKRITRVAYSKKISLPNRAQSNQKTDAEPVQDGVHKTSTASELKGILHQHLRVKHYPSGMNAVLSTNQKILRTKNRAPRRYRMMKAVWTMSPEQKWIGTTMRPNRRRAQRGMM